MKIKTASGTLTINKRSAYGKFLLGYTSTRAWAGAHTLSIAWAIAQEFKQECPSLSWLDTGKLAGMEMLKTQNTASFTDGEKTTTNFKLELASLLEKYHVMLWFNVEGDIGDFVVGTIYTRNKDTFRDSIIEYDSFFLTSEDLRKGGTNGIL